jgi:beta-lactamase regulating signal transducer with metallopeptidase domain
MLQLPFTPGPVHTGTWVALLLEATAKGTVLLVLVMFAMRLLRSQTAAVRHWVLTCSVSAILALPMLTVLLPVWPLPIFPDTALWSYAVGKVGSPSASLGATGELPPRVSPPPRFIPDDPGSNETEAPSWRTALLLLWAGGTGLVLLRIMVGTAMAKRIARRSERCTDARILRMARSVAREIRLGTPARILRSAEIETPLTLGVFEPLVILPYDADRWPDARLRVALLHELSHIKRHDCLTQTVADIACAFYWFHPAAWHAARRLRAERERACDDCVIRSGVRPSQYAAHLLDLACALSGRARPRFALYMAQASQLEERVHAILDPGVRRQPASRTAFAMALLLISSIVVPLAALDPWAPARPGHSIASVAAPPFLNAG